MNIIIEAIQTNQWEKRIKYIREARLPNMYITPKIFQKKLWLYPFTTLRYSLKAKIKQTATKRLNIII